MHVICTRLRPGHLSVRVGDSSRRCEEIVKISNSAFECYYYYYYYNYIFRVLHEFSFEKLVSCLDVFVHSFVSFVHSRLSFPCPSPESSYFLCTLLSAMLLIFAPQCHLSNDVSVFRLTLHPGVCHSVLLTTRHLSFVWTKCPANSHFTSVICSSVSVTLLARTVISFLILLFGCLDRFLCNSFLRLLPNNDHDPY